jgi:hypothetical protein
MLRIPTRDRFVWPPGVYKSEGSRKRLAGLWSQKEEKEEMPINSPILVADHNFHDSISNSN